MLALDRARPGREADLLEAISLCEQGLVLRPPDTGASAWAALAQTRDLLALRLAGLRRGHVVRHHPGPNARRPRRLRFA